MEEKKMAEPDIVRVTDNLANTIDRLYKAGVLASILGFAGILVMLGGELFPWLLPLGIVLTFSGFALLLFTTFKGYAKATKTLKESKKTLDAMQDISLQLIRLTSLVHAYSFKNVGKLNEIIQLVVSRIEAIPFFGEKARKYGLSEASAISQALVENAERLEDIINNIEEALRNGDFERIGEYSNELSEWVKSMHESV
jgi:hypothetical protein